MSESLGLPALVILGVGILCRELNDAVGAGLWGEILVPE